MATDSQYAADIAVSQYASDIDLSQYACDLTIIGASESYYWMTFEDDEIMLYEDGTVMQFEVN
jgi:hypothetical protein